jgi:hypothetical protein
MITQENDPGVITSRLKAHRGLHLASGTDTSQKSSKNEVRCLCLANAKKRQSMTDGSADLDGFPVSEGETLNGNMCCLVST